MDEPSRKEHVTHTHTHTRIFGHIYRLNSDHAGATSPRALSSSSPEHLKCSSEQHAEHHSAAIRNKSRCGGNSSNAQAGARWVPKRGPLKPLGLRVMPRDLQLGAHTSGKQKLPTGNSARAPNTLKHAPIEQKGESSKLWGYRRPVQGNGPKNYG